MPLPKALILAAALLASGAGLPAYTYTWNGISDWFHGTETDTFRYDPGSYDRTFGFARAGFIKIEGETTLPGPISLLAVNPNIAGGGMELLSTNNVLRATAITLNGDLGAAGVGPKSLHLDTSPSGGSINLRVSLGRAGIWNSPAALVATAGGGGVYVQGVGPHGGGWGGTAVSLSGRDIVISTAIAADGAVSLTNSDAGSVSGVLSGAMSLSKSGAGTITLGAANTFAGNVSITGGTLEAAAASGLGATSLGAMNVAGKVVTVGAGGTLKLLAAHALGSAAATAPAASLVIDGGTLWRQGREVEGSAHFSSIGNLTLLNGAVIRTGSGASVVDQSLAFNGSVTVEGATGSSIVATAGTTFNGIHLGTRTGTTTFQVADTGSADDLVVAVELADKASGGQAAFAKTGQGRLVLAATNTYSGTTTVHAGVLAAGADGAFGYGSVSLLGGTLDVGGRVLGNAINLAGGALAGGGTLTGVISGLGLVKSDDSVLTISGANTYSGGMVLGASTLITAGTLVAGGDTALGAGRVGLVGGTLDVGGRTLANEINLSGGALAGGGALTGPIGGPGALRKTGAGSLSIHGHSTHVGGTVVEGGALVVAAVGALGSGTVQVTGGTLDLGGYAVANAITVDGGGLTGLGAYEGAIAVAEGATFALSDATSADVALASGATLKGEGAVGALTQAAGSVLAPGNSPGLLAAESLTPAAGSEMQVEFIDVSGIAGVGHDAVSVGTLDLSSLSALGRYTLRLISLSALPSTQGALDGFDPTTAFAFEVMAYTTLVLPSGYDAENLASLFLIDTSDFLDETGQPIAGGFSLSHDSEANTLSLVYTPIPEPSTHGLLIGGFLLASAVLRRRLRSKPSGSGL